MGSFLTYLDNRKGDPVSGAEPDENYARENWWAASRSKPTASMTSRSWPG